MAAELKYLKEVARAAGVAPITLKRWLLKGEIPEVSRDRNGWRLFNAEEASAVLRFAGKTTPTAKGGSKR